MKWFKANTHEEKHKWHIWFAWYPVAVEVMPDGHYKKVWLENVMRCGEYCVGFDGSWWNWDYREINL